MAETTGDAKSRAPAVAGYLGAEFPFPPTNPRQARSL